LPLTPDAFIIEENCVADIGFDTGIL
jgi:hypothetical protein